MPVWLSCQLRDSASAPLVAEGQRVEAERQEQEAKRVNDANQAAILRLMNELQTVAEGDLTQEATVTEDITGAIADSVNYTVEELRIAGGQRAGHGDPRGADHVAGGSTSTELLAASDRAAARDSRNRPVGAGHGERINEVSAQAQEIGPRWRASRCRLPSPVCRRCRTPSAA